MVRVKKSRRGAAAVVSVVGAATLAVAALLFGSAGAAQAEVQVDHAQGLENSALYLGFSLYSEQGFLLTVPEGVDVLHDITVSVFVSGNAPESFPLTLSTYDSATTAPGNTVLYRTEIHAPTTEVAVVPMGDTPVTPGATYVLSYDTVAAAPGTSLDVSLHDLIVKDAGGWQIYPSMGAWYRATYLTQPTVTSLSTPNATPSQTITITGSGFTGQNPSVTFGGTTAAATVVSDTEITATVPAIPGGRQDVQVTADGLATDTLPFIVIAPTTTLSVDKVTAGDQITVNGSGLPANTPVDIVLHSDPVTLATVTTSASGTFTQQVTIPANTPAGAHTIQVTATGITAPAVDLTVTAAGPVLAATGANATPAIITGSVLLGGGIAALLIVALRRRRRHA